LEAFHSSDKIAGYEISFLIFFIKQKRLLGNGSTGAVPMQAAWTFCPGSPGMGRHFNIEAEPLSLLS